jgi:hypothetical protein
MGNLVDIGYTIHNCAKTRLHGKITNNVEMQVQCRDILAFVSWKPDQFLCIQKDTL